MEAAQEERNYFLENAHLTETQASALENRLEALIVVPIVNSNAKRKPGWLARFLMASS